MSIPRLFSAGRSSGRYKLILGLTLLVGALAGIVIYSSVQPKQGILIGPLDRKESYAKAISERGDVLIYSRGKNEYFIWAKDKGIQKISPPGISSIRKMNDNGQFIGGGGHNRSYIWNTVSDVQDIGSLGGTSTRAQVLNNSGQVAGTSRTEEAEEHGFFWTVEGGMQNIGTLGGNDITVNAINESGQVIGTSTAKNREYYAFLWTPGQQMQNLGSFSEEGGSSANGINNKGQVVGAASVTISASHAFLWTKEHGMQDLRTLGGAYSRATAINDAGQIIGYSDTKNGEEHAFLWTKEHGMQDLGTLGGAYSRATAINDAGQIIGYSDTKNGEKHAFFWTKEHAIQALGALGGEHCEATAINDAGQIVGYVKYGTPWWFKVWEWCRDKMPFLPYELKGGYSREDAVFWEIPPPEALKSQPRGS